MKLDLPRASDFDAGVWFSTSASTRYPTHWHEELELNLVLWGRAKYQIRRHEVEIGPGSLLLLAPGEKHTLMNVSNDLAMWVSAFRCNTVRNAEELSGVRFLNQRAWSVRRLKPERVSELSARHARLFRGNNSRLLRSAASQLLASALNAWQEHHGRQDRVDSFSAQNRKPLHGSVALARALLREPEEALPLSALSLRCGLEAGRLSRVFKQEMGLSVVQFRNHFRVQQFIRHYAYGKGVTMLNAALQCGFGSYAQFHRAFHQVTGYSPSEHLRRVGAGIVLPIAQGQSALSC